MARLTAAARRALPDSAFAGPNRTFPVQDPGHAKAALGLIGNAPKSARAKIHARAEKVLHRPRTTEHKGPGPEPTPQHHTQHAHAHKGHQRAHAAQHDIQVHGAPMAGHSGLLGKAGDGGPATSHGIGHGDSGGDHYREHHELHHDAHPGEGFVGREGAKRHAARSLKTNRFK